MNRRTFLKGLMAVAGMSALGVPAVAEAVPDAFIWDEAIADSALDLPVTQDTPLCYIELDGHRFSLADARLDIHQDRTDCFAGSSWQRYSIPTALYWTIDCFSYRDQPAYLSNWMMEGRTLDCRLIMKNNPSFSGKVRVTEYTISLNKASEIASEFTLHGLGDLKMVSLFA